MRHQRILALVQLTALLVLLCLQRREAILGLWMGQAARLLESASALHIAVQPRCRRLACNQTPCDRLAGNQTLQWSAESATCDPDVCGGVALPDIPGFDDGGTPAKLACSLRHGLLDTRRARQCLANKRVLLMGDSTMVELAHDLNMLLAGLGGNASAVDGAQPPRADRDGSVAAFAFVWVPVEISCVSGKQRSALLCCVAEYCLHGTRIPREEVMHLQVGGPTTLGLNITFLNAHFHMLVDTAHDNIHIVTKYTGAA